jgi:hypothetical protein
VVEVPNVNIGVLNVVIQVPNLIDALKNVAVEVLNVVIQVPNLIDALENVAAGVPNVKVGVEKATCCAAPEAIATTPPWF